MKKEEINNLIDKMFENLELHGVLGGSKTLYLQNEYSMKTLRNAVEELLDIAYLRGAGDYNKKIKEVIRKSNSWEEFQEQLKNY